MHGFSCEIAIVYRRSQGDPAEHPLVAAARAQTTPITQLDGHTRGLPDSIHWLRHKLAGEQFSILHCHEYKTDLMGALAAWRLAKPRPALIATVRHTEPGLQMGLFQALDSLVLHRFDRLTVPSRGALQELRRWPSLRRRSRVIHHARRGRFPVRPRLPGPAWPPRNRRTVDFDCGKAASRQGASCLSGERAKGANGKARCAILDCRRWRTAP